MLNEYIFPINVSHIPFIPQKIEDAKNIIDLKDINDSSILMWAAYYKMDALVEFCLISGVDKTHKNKFGSTALDWAEERFNNEKIIAMLK